MAVKEGRQSPRNNLFVAVNLVLFVPLLVLAAATAQLDPTYRLTDKKRRHSVPVGGVMM